MKTVGVRPGIWMRPTALMKVDDPRRVRAGPCTAEEKPLDLTLPENLTLIRDDVARVRSWATTSSSTTFRPTTSLPGGVSRWERN